MGSVQIERILMSATVNALKVGRSAAKTLRLLQAFQAGGLTPWEGPPGEPLIEPA